MLIPTPPISVELYLPLDYIKNRVSVLLQFTQLFIIKYCYGWGYNNLQVYKEIQDTNFTLTRIHEILMAIWREIEKTAQKKAKQDFKTGRKDPHEKA